MVVCHVYHYDFKCLFSIKLKVVGYFMTIPCQRHLFSIPTDVAYLNTAYMSPLMTSVVDSINLGARLKATPWDISIPDFFKNSELARELFSRIVNVKPESVALVPSASYGMETAARNLKVGEGQTIVMLENQFPSNVYPWRRLIKKTGGKIIKVSEEDDRPITEALLEKIDKNCAIVALPNVLWTNGTLVDLIAVGKKCKQVGAALVLDLTQSLGAMETNLSEIDPDFAVVASYKWMLSPYSTGYLYVSEKHWDGDPLEGNWISRKESKNFSNLIDYTDNYEVGAMRFDVGERANFALLPGAIQAMKQIEEWGVKDIESTLSHNNSILSERLRHLGFLIPSEGNRGSHFIGATFPCELKKDILQILASNQIYVSERGGVMRITPHLWNNIADFDKFINVLSENL